MEDEAHMYRLNGVAHLAGNIDQEETTKYASHEQIIPYLETVGLYHLDRLNSQWFWVDEALDVAYQLGLPIDGEAVSGCLIDFENLTDNGRPAWEWFPELFGELPPPNKVKQMKFHFTWFHERFRVLPADANEETVHIYARAYIMILLSSQLFGDKNANRVHLRWLSYLASMDKLGKYSWGSAALAWLPSGFDVFGFPLASRCATYLPTTNVGEQRVVSARLSLDRLRDCDFLWEPYSALDVAAIVHPEILVVEHSRLWRAVTCLIYFAPIEWHQVHRVVPQFGGVQHLSQLALNIDWLHAKDSRGGDRWFSSYYQEGHLHWNNRLYSVIQVDRVADPGPLVEYLD
ncbi:uncharacterized protein DS421_15g513400 [Arachis hypogaea]|nr:uncharacterized protein DS421_15g513400 [Arachis hypogaea]